MKASSSYRRSPIFGKIWKLIKRFKTKAFPLYESLGQLYEGSIAEGNYNFTSTSATSREELPQTISDDDEPEEEIEAEIAEGDSEDVFELDPAPSAHSMSQVERQEVKGKRPVAAARNKLAKIPKRSPKKWNSDGIVQVMHRMVQMKEKEVNQEPAQKFSITRCMDALKTLGDITADFKISALDVFRNVDNREMFLNLADDKDDKDGTAMAWLRKQIAKLA